MNRNVNPDAPSNVVARPPGLVRHLADRAVATARLPARTVEAARQVFVEAGGLVDLGVVLAARALALVEAVEALVGEIALTSARAAAVVSQAEAVTAEAETTVLLADVQLVRARELLDVFAPQLAALEPVLRRAAQVMEPRHADAVTRLLDLTPEVAHLISPALTNLGDLTPELHQLAERFDTIGQIVEGIPGAGLFKRRGAADDDTVEGDTP